MYFKFKNWYEVEWHLCKLSWYQGIVTIIVDFFNPHNPFMERHFVPWWKVKKDK